MTVSHAPCRISHMAYSLPVMSFALLTMNKDVNMTKYKIVTLMTHFMVVDTGGIGCASIDTRLRSTCTLVAKSAWSSLATHWPSPWVQSCDHVELHPERSKPKTNEAANQDIITDKTTC